MALLRSVRIDGFVRAEAAKRLLERTIELGHMADDVRRQGEPSAAAGDARTLAKGGIGVAEVVHAEVGDHEVERTVGERQARAVGGGERNAVEPVEAPLRLGSRERLRPRVGEPARGPILCASSKSGNPVPQPRSSTRSFGWNPK